MPRSLTRAIIYAVTVACAALVAGQDYPPISAVNIASLKSHAQIDFADFPAELNIGWYEAKADASEFIVFDSAGRLYQVSEAGIDESWTYAEPSSGQLFSLIDAAYIDDEALMLYLLDGGYFINERALISNHEPVALVSYGDSLFVEALGADRHTVFRQFAWRQETDSWQFVAESPLPATDPQKPAVRVGRIDFPIVLYSSLAGGALQVYRYPDAFASGTGRDYSLTQGPAVFGAVNGGAGSHFAWSDPASARLNLLDLKTGENRVVAEIGGAYAQYHLLTADASAILIVNLDLAPEVFAWDVETSQRFDLGPYRSCGRIPDKVTLSNDGRALIIGCDTGLDIWRVEASEDSEAG